MRKRHGVTRALQSAIYAGVTDVITDAVYMIQMYVQAFHDKTRIGNDRSSIGITEAGFTFRWYVHFYYFFLSLIVYLSSVSLAI